MNKNISVGILCFLLGVVLSVAIIFYLLIKNPSLLQGYIDSYKSRSSLKGVAVVDLKQLSEDAVIQKYNIIMPKSKVSQEYYDTFNLVYNELVLLDSTNRNNLYPLVVKAKVRLEAKNYDEIPLLATQIQNINETSKKREAIVTSFLNSLSKINDKITDKEIKLLTVDFIATGQKLNNSFIAYSDLIDEIISGKITEQTAGETKSMIETLTASMADFRNASQKLIGFFAKSFQDDIKKGTISTSTANYKK